jgi:hypothetical protein
VSSDKNILIDSRPIGYYKDQNKLMIEKVIIPEELDSEHIIFALLDDGQDGLCCDKGQGLFHIFVGGIDAVNLIAKGSSFTRLQHFDIDLQQRTTSTGNGGIRM